MARLATDQTKKRRLFQGAAAHVSIVALFASMLVGVTAVTVGALAGPVSSAQADPPPTDPPTSITLASNKSTFAAGSSATLTATTDTDVADTDSTITITDETTSAPVTTCTSGTTCVVPVSFFVGGPHTYVATVDSLTSNEVTVGREGWTVTLTSTATSFSAGGSVTLTATANQDVGNTNNNYLLRIFDTTSETWANTCNTGTTCTVPASFYAGAAHTYVAEVSAGSYYATPGTTTDVEATSDGVVVSRDAWTVSLTSSATTFVAGDPVTLTAATNQDVSATNGSYMIRIMDDTSGTILATCGSGLSCAAVAQFYSGGAHTYSAEVSAGPSWAAYGATTDIQATSNTVTVSRLAWTLALSSNRTTFSAGDYFTLTATANQDVGATNGSYEIRIFDVTAGTFIGTCSSGTVCIATSEFYSGPAHTYRAEVSAGPNWATYGTTTDVQATSGDVVETRAAWSVTLTTSATTFAAGHEPALTAVANQNVGSTNGNYVIRIFDVTTGAQIWACNDGTTCTARPVNFYSGPAHTYRADVSAGPSYLTPTYGASSDVQNQSNEVSVARAAWTVTMTGSSVYTPPTSATDPGTVTLTLSTVANQNVGNTNGQFQTVIVNYTTGQDVVICNSGTTCSVTITFEANQAVGSYIAFITKQLYLGTFVPTGEIAAASGGFSADTGKGATLPGELAGGSNAAENAPCPCGGDPVSTETGEFFLPTADIGLPGVGPALSVDRTYSSMAADVDGPFGFGWSANFESSLDTLVAGDTDDPLPRRVQITQENGATVVFAENWDHTYTAPQRVRATLTNDPTTGDWTFIRQLRQVMVYSPDGELIAEKDLLGNTVTYAYTGTVVTSISGVGARSIDLTWSSGHVIALTDSAGRTVTYGYSSGNLTSATAVDGAETTYGYDSSHRITTVTKPDGGVTTNTYDTSDRVTSQTDPVGRVTTFDYSDGTTYTIAPDASVITDTYSGGLLTSAAHAAGETYAETTSYTYDSAGNVASVTDPMGKVTSSTYDAHGDTLTTTDPLSRTTTWTYDSLGDVLSVTDPLSHVKSATYGTTGEKLSTTSPGGHIQNWTYNTNGTVATSVDARGKTTSYTYNGAGDVLSSADPDGRVRSATYDSAGHATSTTDAGGNLTVVTTDASGRELTSKDPNNHTTTFSYDLDGNRISVENAGGHITTADYDSADQLIATTAPGGHTTRYSYTGTGLPATTTDPNDHLTTTAYNALGLATSITDANSNVTHLGYDGDGRQVSITLPSGDESTVTYDDAGQKTSATDASGRTSTYVYNDDGQLTSVTDPLSRVTGDSYTLDGQLATVTLPDSSAETTSYNANGQATDFENADGAHTTYAYDDAGLLTSKTEPGSITTAYTYTTAGQLHVTTNPDTTTITDSYNAGGLLTGVAESAAGATSTGYSYDADNLRTGMTDATGTSSYSYNSRGLMTSETNGAGTTIGYGYDDASQLTSITYPGSKTVTYGYDPDGQMTSMTDSASNETDFTWTANGQLHTQADPNGITQTRSYDADGRTTGIATANSTNTISNFTYGYDDDGELTSDSTTDPNNSTPLTHTYGYSALTQLTTISNGTASASYTNTPGGQVTGNTAGSTLAYNSAREITSLTPGSGPATTFGYDANGNRTSATVAATGTTAASTTEFSFDANGDLASVSIPASDLAPAETVNYASDGDGLRQSRTVGSSTKNYLWDTNEPLPLLLDDGTNSYLYGPSSAPIAQVNDSTGVVQYLSDDLIGSTRLITGGSGTVAGVNNYGEYGTLTSHTGTAMSAIGYSGNWTDGDTAMVYLRARDYDPATAQFLTVDSQVDTTGQAYSYASDDPLDRMDPSGNSASPAQNPLGSLAATVPKVAQFLTCQIRLLGSSIEHQWLDVTAAVGASVHDFLQTFIPNDAIDSTKDPTYDFSDSMSYAITDTMSARTPAEKLVATIETGTALVTGWVSLYGTQAVRYLYMRAILATSTSATTSAASATTATAEATAAVPEAAAAAPEVAAVTAPAAAGETTLAGSNALLASTKAQEVASAAW